MSQAGMIPLTALVQIIPKQRAFHLYLPYIRYLLV